MKQELVDFYQNEYLPLQVSEELYLKRNLNQTLNYEIKKMITCYKNNITANYTKSVDVLRQCIPNLRIEIIDSYMYSFLS